MAARYRRTASFAGHAVVGQEEEGVAHIHLVVAVDVRDAAVLETAELREDEEEVRCADVAVAVQVGR